MRQISSLDGTLGASGAGVSRSPEGKNNAVYFIVNCGQFNSTKGRETRIFLFAFARPGISHGNALFSSFASLMFARMNLTQSGTVLIQFQRVISLVIPRRTYSLATKGAIV